MNHSQHAHPRTSFGKGKVLLICVSLFVLALSAIVFFKVSVSTVVFLGFALACPLMHIWMMKDGGHKH
jgi:hypothetical protein